MKYNRFLAWLIIVILAVVPVVLLFVLGPEKNLSTFSEVTQNLGQMAGLIGVTLFALTFILSMRIKFIEDAFGGLDKVYVAHGILGGVALGLILLHPLLLVLKFIPADFYKAAKYLLPSSYWSVNFGIIAFLSLIGLVYVTLYTKIKYHNWKFSHKFLGLVFIFAVLHIFLVRGSASRDFIFNGYYIFATVVSIIGLSGFFYTLFIKNSVLHEAFYIIESINAKNEVYEITLVPEGKPLAYKSGQFIFVRFYNQKLSREAHPFSVASKSNERKLKIVIKNLGDFTSGLKYVSAGEKVSIEGPYGRFSFSKNKINQVWLAGGLGITPFLGMAEDMKKDQRKIYLIYSVKKHEEFISYGNLKEMEKENKNFKFFPWVSNEKGFLSVSDISKIVGDLKNKEFYICGPSGFKSSIIKQLIKSNVKRERINEESFNFI
jgi:predicted ferric reductase